MLLKFLTLSLTLLVEDYKADVAAKADDGRTTLHCAAAEGHEEVVQVLKSAEQMLLTSPPPP
jgi:ankyrin repeat protein